MRRRPKNHSIGLVLILLVCMPGCRMIPLTYPHYKSEQTIEDVQLPEHLVLGTRYRAVRTFERAERADIEDCRRVLQELEAHRGKLAAKMHPDGPPPPTITPDGFEELIPLPQLSGNKQQYREDMIRKIRWHQMRIEKAYGQYIAANPHDWEAMGRLGTFFYENGHRRHAYHWWQQAMNAAPDEAELHANMGTFYADAGEDMKALRAFRKAVELDGGVADYHARLGNLYFSARAAVQQANGMEPAAIFRASQDAFEAAWKLEPANFERARDCYENYLTVKYFNLEPEAFEAAEMATVDRCLGMQLTETQRVAVLTHKGQLYRRRKEYEKACQVLVEAVMLSDKQYAPALDLLRRVEREK